MWPIYILLGIIAVGVLLASEPGQKLLGGIIVIGVIGLVLYIGFYVLIFCVAFFREHKSRIAENPVTTTQNTVTTTKIPATTTNNPPLTTSEDGKFTFSWFDNDISELTTNVCTVRKNFDMAGKHIKTCYKAGWEPWVNSLLKETVGPSFSYIEENSATQAPAESVLEYPDGSKSLVFRGCRPRFRDELYVYFIIEPKKKQMDVVMRDVTGKFEYYGPNAKALGESDLAKLLTDQNNIFINSRTYLLPDQ
jgi:hypothetical protein